jgi:hypothetical protein
MQNSDYYFNHLGRIGDDYTDRSQQNVQNYQYANLVLADYFSDKKLENQVQFVSSYPGISLSNSMGNGLSGSVVDQESNLLWKTGQERPIEKLQLFQRPFVTVPYLGKGSCNPIIESQLQQGETVRGKKSVSTVMEQSFYLPQNHPVAYETVQVEEIALGGWSRGGMDTRTTGDSYHK